MINYHFLSVADDAVSRDSATFSTNPPNNSTGNTERYAPGEITYGPTLLLRMYAINATNFSNT